MKRRYVIVESAVSAECAAPNPSIERTSLSWLRQPKAAAHVERWASQEVQA